MHIIKVCVGCSCERNFGGANLKKAEQVLGIKAGETTKDGKIKLEKWGCLGNCDKAPNVLFMQAESPLQLLNADGELLERITPNKLAERIKDLT